MSRTVRTAAATVLAFLPAAARAHLVHTGLGPFYDGASHLGLTPEDLLPAIALALLAGQRGAETGRSVLLALPAAWLLGGLAGLAAPAVVAAPPLVTASFLVTGGLVAAEARLLPAWVVGLAIALGVGHGYLDGSALSRARLGVLALAGTVASLFVAVALAAAAVVALRAAWARIAVRVAGSWIAAVGLLLLGWSLRGG